QELLDARLEKGRQLEPQLLQLVQSLAVHPAHPLQTRRGVPQSAAPVEGPAQAADLADGEEPAGPARAHGPVLQVEADEHRALIGQALVKVFGKRTWERADIRGTHWSVRQRGACGHGFLSDRLMLVA